MIRTRVLAAAVAAVISVTATPAEPERAREDARPAAQKLDVRALFEPAPGATDPSSVQIIVARIGPDGKLIKACVDSEAAARRFLDAPVETLRTKKAQKQ
jgi:hypothetical protein